jgi:hypothetical protein
MSTAANPEAIDIRRVFKTYAIVVALAGFAVGSYGQLWLGEDLGNLVPDAVNDLHAPGRALSELDQAAFTGYVEGLREAGWDGDARIVRLAMCASAVKYEWLAAAMLGRAIDQGAQSSDGYGGAAVDRERLLSERALVLAWLVDRAAEAERLADDLRR